MSEFTTLLQLSNASGLHNSTSERRGVRRPRSAEEVTAEEVSQGSDSVQGDLEVSQGRWRLRTSNLVGTHVARRPRSQLVFVLFAASHLDTNQQMPRGVRAHSEMSGNSMVSLLRLHAAVGAQLTKRLHLYSTIRMMTKAQEQQDLRKARERRLERSECSNEALLQLADAEC